MTEKGRLSDKAVSTFQGDFVCSQAVFSTYAPLLGLDRETALRISNGFGGGMARMGETCGALTGAFMLMGLKYGADQPGQETHKEKTYEMIRNLVSQFEKEFGTIRCRELLSCDISTPEGRQNAKDRDLFNQLCPKYVKFSAELIEKVL